MRKQSLGFWFYLLVVCLGVLVPLAELVVYGTLIQVEESHRDLLSNQQWTHYKQSATSVALVVSAMGAYAAHRLLFVRTKQSIRVVVILLWLIGPGSALAYGAVTMTALREGNAASAFELLLHLLRNAVLAACWTWYLLRSKKIESVFGTEAAPPLAGHRNIGPTSLGVAIVVLPIAMIAASLWIMERAFAVGALLFFIGSISLLVLILRKQTNRS